MNDTELVKSKLDIVSVISNYVELKSAGSIYKANCPFHNEKTPSFTVTPKLQRYKCFGCGKYGDVITFLQEIERLTFPEALKLAAEKAGVELTSTSFKKDKKEEEEKKRIIEVNTITAKYYQYIFTTHKLGKEAREYATKVRKLDSENLNKFMFGYAPNSKENLKTFLISKGYSEKDLLNWGLLVERYGKSIDKFRDRLLQPIKNTRGEIVGFSGRYLGTFEGAPKYLNSAESNVYKKNEILYGLYEAEEAIRQEKFVILVEGNIDLVASHVAGVKNVVAPLGTSFTEQQARLLKRYAEEFVFCFDNDKAGIAALVRSIEIVENLGINHKTIDLGKYKDSDELIKSSHSLWLEVVKNRVESVDYLIKKFSSNLDLGTVEGKNKLKTLILPVLSSLKDEIKISHYSKQLSLIFDVTKEDLLHWISEYKGKGRISFDQIPTEKQEEHEPSVNKYELYLLSLILQSANKDLIKDMINIFESESGRNIFTKIQNTDNFDIDKIAENLSDKDLAVLEETWLWDLSNISDLELEITKIYRRLKNTFLRKEILQYKKKLALDESDKQALQKLNELTKMLKE